MLRYLWFFFQSMLAPPVAMPTRIVLADTGKTFVALADIGKTSVVLE